MKIIIQCCGRKRGDLWAYNGQKKVKFVAHPDQCDKSDLVLLCRPDDVIPHNTTTWRQKLILYNQNSMNPDGLLRAADLYAPEIYQLLASQYGWENTFILSAGWGLVRADFLLPYYDITFSSQAHACKRRTKGDKYNDFNQLLHDGSIDRRESLYFFGGKDYLRLYYELTQNLRGKKVVYHKSSKIPRKDGYEYIQYSTKQSTNWHYTCAKDFIHGKIEQ